MKRTNKPKKNRRRLLTVKQQAFADLYIPGDKPNYECYMAVYNTKNQKQASEQASILLSKPHVKEYIKRYREKGARRVEIKVADVLQGLLRIATFDHRKLEDENGKFIQSIKGLDDDTALAITEVEYQTVYEQKGKIRKPKQIIKKIKSESKANAWKMIGDYLDMFNGEGNKQSPQEFINDVREFADQVSEGVPGGEI